MKDIRAMAMEKMLGEEKGNYSEKPSAEGMIQMMVTPEEKEVIETMRSQKQEEDQGQEPQGMMPNDPVGA